MQLGRLVDIATDLFAMAAIIGRAHSGKEPHVKEIAGVFCKTARNRIKTNFRMICCNPDKANNKLADKILAQNLSWQEKAY